MRYNHLSCITIRHFAALDFLLNHTLIRVVSSISQCLRLVVPILYLYLVQQCHAAVTLLLSEACFCDKDGGQFDLNVGKRWQVTFLALT